MEIPFYSVVIPVYNSTRSLRPLVQELSEVFTSQVQAPAEILLVDDGSPNPGTWPAIEELVREFPQVRGVQLMRNFGKPGALVCGFSEARGQYIITMDDDLQHSPSSIPLLIAEQAHDVVIARFDTLQTTAWRKLSSSLKDRANQLLLDKPPRLRLSPLKLFKRQVVQNMLQITTPYPSVAAQLFYVTKDVVNVPVPHGRRQHGRSGFTFLKMSRLFLNLLINNSSFMLRMVASVGFIIAIASFLLGIYYIVLKLAGHITVSGWTSLVVISLFTSGLILFSLGIIGEYLIRIINATEHRPPFIVRRRTEEQ